MVQHLVLNNNSQDCRLMSNALLFANPSENNLPCLLRTISLFGCCVLKNYFVSIFKFFSRYNFLMVNLLKYTVDSTFISLFAVILESMAYLLTTRISKPCFALKVQELKKYNISKGNKKCKRNKREWMEYKTLNCVLRIQNSFFNVTWVTELTLKNLFFWMCRHLLR
jgi:hypothetical protein